MTTIELLADAPDHRQPNPPAYRVSLAVDSTDVIAAQRLRYDVFSTECGATTPGPDGLDADRFDDQCDHLIVRQPPTVGEPRGQAVATYRLLPPQAHDTQPRSLSLYANTEFDISPLEGILDRTVEAGRSCVAAQHRGPAPISLLWRGIAGYLRLTQSRYLVGCASIGLADGGGQAAAFADLAGAKYLAPPQFRCRPRRDFRVGRIVRPAKTVIPPLLRGYLRLGAVVCGPPAIDAAFGTADFLVLLDLEAADPRYLRFFLGEAA